MLRKPNAITRIGIVQVILSSTFVIWLLFFPSTATNFAWPISPEMSAMFIGAGFIARAYLGVYLWRRHIGATCAGRCGATMLFSPFC